MGVCRQLARLVLLEGREPRPLLRALEQLDVPQPRAPSLLKEARAEAPALLAAHLLAHAPQREAPPRARLAARAADGARRRGGRVGGRGPAVILGVGRADDVIISAGYRIGPFEVESALVEHPAVVEAAVIGVPDDVAGNLIKAFVTLHPGHEASEALEAELLGFARKKLGPAATPRMLDIVKGLPKTRSGKIMRRLLKARELGLPEGDTSTLMEDVGGAKKDDDEGEGEA